MERLRDARGGDHHDQVCEADTQLLPPGDDRASAIAVAMASILVGVVSHAEGARPTRGPHPAIRMSGRREGSDDARS